MDMKICLVILLNICQMFAYVEIQRSFEFENCLSEEQSNFWVWRSEASRLKSLRLVDNYRRYRVELKICVEPAEGRQEANIIFDDIRYANDGPNDFIFITFEDELWFSYSTYEKWAHGHEWNIYRNTGRRGDMKVLPRGVYTIGVSVITDKWGLELDKIRLIDKSNTCPRTSWKYLLVRRHTCTSRAEEFHTPHHRPVSSPSTLI